MTYNTDVLILGGGLTGIFAGLRLGRAGARAILVDNPLPSGARKVGGFASFSGAKFSLPPAGLGLVAVAGGIDNFNSALTTVLSILGLGESDGHLPEDALSRQNGADRQLRKYHSFVLTPVEIDGLLQRLSWELNQRVQVIQAKVFGISPLVGGWRVKIADPNMTNAIEIEAETVFYAGGRLSEDLLFSAGARPTEGKGLDIGFRLEFSDRECLRELRNHGPDAKILSGQCRTFCLNVPGNIFRYPFDEISIPGGVVANPTEKSANVGILLRVPDKAQRLSYILSKTRGLHAEILFQSNLIRRGPVKLPALMSRAYTEESSRLLENFCTELSEAGLIDFRTDYRIHLPLLDWHWHTFALPDSHRTTLPNVFALGDSAGHARGLLQAALSGWLAAEEYLS